MISNEYPPPKKTPPSSHISVADSVTETQREWRGRGEGAAFNFDHTAQPHRLFFASLKTNILSFGKKKSKWTRETP